MRGLTTILTLMLISSVVWCSCVVDVNTGASNCINTSSTDDVIHPMTEAKQVPQTNATLQYMLEKSNVIITNVVVIAPPVGNYTHDTLVDGVWVSARVCNSDPSICINKTVANATTTKQPTARTAAQCAWARDRDWMVYVNINAAENMVIDYLTPNIDAKNAILDNLANSFQSYQARCLRGEINKNDV